MIGPEEFSSHKSSETGRNVITLSQRAEKEESGLRLQIEIIISIVCKPSLSPLISQSRSLCV